MINLYVKSGKSEGYFDAESVIRAGFIFNYIVGGRAIGKTFGFFEYFIDNGIPFILMRRTQVEADLQGDMITSSLKPHLLRNDIKARFSKFGGGKLCSVTDPEGKPICVICALSTISSLRGIDLSEYGAIVYDEFITEPHVKKIKAEGQALENAYETINRNRELEGLPPVKLYCLSNSLNLANDIFIYRDLLPEAERMISTGEEISIHDPRTLLIIAQRSPISARKAGTAQYQSASEEYAKMAISNEFILNDFTYVKKLSNLKEYKCVCAVGDRFIYKHKSNGQYYVCDIRAQTKNTYTNSYSDLQRFRRERWKIYVKYLDGAVRFDTYQSVALFEKYYK